MSAAQNVFDYPQWKKGYEKILVDSAGFTQVCSYTNHVLWKKKNRGNLGFPITSKDNVPASLHQILIFFHQLRWIVFFFAGLSR